MGTATEQPDTDTTTVEVRRGPGRPPGKPPTHPAQARKAAKEAELVVHVTPLPSIKGVEVEGSPAWVNRIFINAASSASQDTFACHEFHMAKRKLEIFGDNLLIELDWSPHDPAGRGRLLTKADFYDEVERLKRAYQFTSDDGREYDLFQDMFGSAKNLLEVMQKIEKRYRQIAAENRPLTREDLQQLCDLANPHTADLELTSELDFE